MNIIYNGVPKERLGTILTYNDIPNILSVEELISGSYGVFSFIFQGNLKSQVSADTQYSVTFLDETVSNVRQPQKAKNKRFYIDSDPTSTAASFARALRNCPSILANFTIEHSGTEVELVARSLGKSWSNVPNYYTTTIPSPYLTTSAHDGDVFSDLYNATIQVDLIDGDNKYITTLEKNFYGNECAFNVSPLLSTISEYGTDNKYVFNISSIAENGEYSLLGSVSGYTACGYDANQSDKYKYLDNMAEVALNKNRNQIRYIYGTKLPYSFIWGGVDSVTITYRIYDSTLTQIYTNGGEVHQTSNYDSHIVDEEFTIPVAYRERASYIDVTVGSDTVRFNVIKPLNATEYYQRVLWRNEYGGIEFFDFTGQRSESDSISIETYEKNIYDLYTAKNSAGKNIYEKKKIYSNDYKKDVKLTTHLMEENGKWFTGSLLRSKRVWTEINGKIYFIIPKAVDVSEDNTYNNIFTATLTYEYSQLS